MPPLFPERPTRSQPDLRRSFTPFTSQFPSSEDPAWRDQTVDNPWIPLSLVPAGVPPDERYWLSIEKDPAIHGAMDSRVSQLLGGGVQLERGTGEGSEELFEYWQWNLEELPVVSLVALGLKAIFRGWQIFENRGEIRTWEGREVFALAESRDALAWQFRWTNGRDLVYRPASMEERGYRHSSALPAKMKWWTPAMGSLTNPYGSPLHASYAWLDYSYRELSKEGLIAIKRSQGFLEIRHGIRLSDSLSEDKKAKVSEIQAVVENTLKQWQATGALIIPEDVKAQWVELTAAIEGWFRTFEWFGAQARTFYAGGGQLGSLTSNTGARSAIEVQEREAQRRAILDALLFLEPFRQGLLRPWSAWNAAVIAPRAFPGTASTARLQDVPLAAVPSLKFRALEKIREEDIAVLQALVSMGILNADGSASEPGEPQPIRIDAEEAIARSRWPLLRQDEEGPHPDLSKKEMPPALRDVDDAEDADAEDADAEDPEEEPTDPVPSR